MTKGTNDVLLANRNGFAIHINEQNIRSMGRLATGVRGMKLAKDDEVVGMIVIKDPEKETIMVVSEKGFGKRSKLEDYRLIARGGKGVKTINVTEKTGALIAFKSVTDENDLMIINKSGVTIRLNVAKISIIGRATQGVKLIDLKKRNEEIASVCKVPASTAEDEKEDLPEGAENEENQEEENQ
jgi:DNA gyrase subunit A